MTELFDCFLRIQQYNNSTMRFTLFQFEVIAPVIELIVTVLETVFATSDMVNDMLASLVTVQDGVTPSHGKLVIKFIILL